MLSSNESRRAATQMVDLYGEVAVAAALLKAQQAREQGRMIDMANWRRIAQAAAKRLEMN